MVQDALSQVPLAIVAATLTTVATLVNVGVTWLKDRNASARRIQTLDEAKKYIDFWTAIKSLDAPTAADDVQMEAIDTAFQNRVSLAKYYVETRGTYLPRQRDIAGPSAPSTFLRAAIALFIAGGSLLLIVHFNGVLPPTILFTLQVITRWSLFLGIVMSIFSLGRNIDAQIKDWKTIEPIPRWPGTSFSKHRCE